MRIGWTVMELSHFCSHISNCNGGPQLLFFFFAIFFFFVIPFFFPPNLSFFSLWLSTVHTHIYTHVVLFGYPPFFFVVVLFTPLAQCLVGSVVANSIVTRF